MTDLMIASGTDLDGLDPNPDDARLWRELLTAYERALWAGNLLDAEGVARRALALRGSLVAVHEQLITPALHQVGVLWSTGELTVADEHAATEATLRAMAGVYAAADEVRPASRERRCVITTSAEGEEHGVGLRMVADTLELAGHEVIHCGVDTPTEDLIALARSSHADAVAISFTMASSGDNLAATARRLWRALPDLPMIVGGQGLPKTLPAGPVTRVSDLTELEVVVGGLPSRRTAAEAHPRSSDSFVARLPRARRPEQVVPPLSGVGPAPFLQAIFDDAAEAMVTLDTTGTVTGWNRAAEVLWGRRAEEAIGGGLSALISAPARARMLLRRFREAIAGATVESRELDLSPADRSERELALRFIPVREEGVIVGAALVARDLGAVRADHAASEGHHCRRIWHNRIEHALDNDRLLLASQPIIDLAGDHVDHHELLLRMRMGGRTVMPGEFIPPAERSGQIRTIDRWVAERGIELAEALPTAVNISGASLSDGALVTTIENTLFRVGVDPARITFEITETAAAENLEAATALVRRLRELGCRVALDDFGTGFGSFTYLSRLPVTELKIDGEFTRGVRDGAGERRVVDAVVSVARAFGIRTVAEGVEDAETLEVLREAGVDLGQGWLFGRPALIDAEKEPLEGEAA